METSVKVTSNSPSQDYTHPDDHNLPNYLFIVKRKERHGYRRAFRSRSQIYMAEWTLHVEQSVLGANIIALSRKEVLFISQ